MRDKGLIYAGLVGFLVLVTFPIWYNVAGGTTSTGPEHKLPVEEKVCVAPVDYMRTSHMDLLINWRDDVVRRNIRNFVAFDGRTHTMSLTGTCLGCHTSKADFCDRCHNYAGVNPPCWDCHIDPSEVRKGAVYARR